MKYELNDHGNYDVTDEVAFADDALELGQISYLLGLWGYYPSDRGLGLTIRQLNSLAKKIDNLNRPNDKKGE